jgi:type I restriction enzyme M protein
MQDDAYLIAADGWVAKPVRILETDKKGKTKDKGWSCDLLPKPYIVERYFIDEQMALREQEAELERIVSQRGELEEEHSGEEDVFDGFERINAAQVKDRIAEIGDNPDDAEELAVLRQWLEINRQEAALKKAVKEAEAALDLLAYEKYPQLSEAEVKSMVVEDKWLNHLYSRVYEEITRVSQTLTGRVLELAERYETPLPELEKEVSALSARVEGHLKRMGAVWK